MSGQSITDRITAAQHSVTGSAVSKTVCKATTHEVMGPKKKHLDCEYLLLKQCFKLNRRSETPPSYGDGGATRPQSLRIAYMLLSVHVVGDYIVFAERTDPGDKAAGIIKRGVKM